MTEPVRTREENEVRAKVRTECLRITRLLLKFTAAQSRLARGLNALEGR